MTGSGVAEGLALGSAEGRGEEEEEPARGTLGEIGSGFVFLGNRLGRPFLFDGANSHSFPFFLHLLQTG